MTRQPTPHSRYSTNVFVMSRMRMVPSARTSAIRRALAFGAALFLTGCAAAPQKSDHPHVTVTKLKSCSCCQAWVTYLEADGFQVRVIDVADMAPIKAEKRVPKPLESCHTAEIDGYLIEGHVSTGDIRRLHRERPAVRGLFVPGMPAGAPGEHRKNPAPYDVIALKSDGSSYVFATHDPAEADANAERAPARPAP